jgi:hypothetical protein
MESIYLIVTIHVNETSWAHIWRLCSLYLGMGYDINLHWIVLKWVLLGYGLVMVRLRDAIEVVFFEEMRLLSIY